MTMAVPELDLDLFDPASLRDPFDDYRQLRDAGAVVRLKRPDVFAIGRFAEVGRKFDRWIDVGYWQRLL